MKNKLTEDEKRLADVLLSLQTHAFNSLNERRRYEWRLSISLWTAMVVLLAFLLKREVALLSVWVKVALTLVAAVVAVLHAVWMKGAGRRNGADVRTSYFWEAKTRELLDVEYPKAHQTELDAFQATSGYFRTFSYVYCLSVQHHAASGCCSDRCCVVPRRHGTACSRRFRTAACRCVFGNA
jgi:hypothetical protein